MRLLITKSGLQQAIRSSWARSFMAGILMSSTCAQAQIPSFAPLPMPGLNAKGMAAPASAPGIGLVGKSSAFPTAVAPVMAATPSTPELTPTAYSNALEETNIFDAQRKLWPDKRPPIPPPAPPPPPAAVSDKDLQLYGVVIVGQLKRATIKVGSRYAPLDTQGRGFATLGEGQSLGDWVVAEIHPTHLVLGAPGGKQTVMFNKKTDRVATAGIQVAQVTSTPGTSDAQLNSGATPAAPGSDANATRNPGVPANAVAGTASSNAAENTIRNAQPGSLAAAIGAAQAAAAAAQAQNAPPPPNFNPFLQLFPKQ